MTLVCVDYHVTDDVLRLAESFRKFVEPDGPVVVAQNGLGSSNRRLRASGIRCVNHGFNVGHGIGLDWAMRQVTTQYTLICDPDTAIIGPGFRNEVLGRVTRFGAASIDNGASFYHPVCVAFNTNLWKNVGFSFEQRWHATGGWDVAGELTEILGGLNHAALIPRTRAAGPPLPSGRDGEVHYYGEVFGDVFTNTYCMARKKLEPHREDFDGWSTLELNEYHSRWRGWVQAITEGTATVEDFPTTASM